jgi:glycine hydroxymethyltransferase
MTDPAIYAAVQAEKVRQSEGMELIASENYQSAAVLEVQSSHLANKYSEWFPGRRYYGWQENTDTVEQLAIDRAKAIFRADHANVQALSGAAANVAAYAAMMEPGDTILWMDLSHGWHLTHGAPVTFLSKVYNFIRYKTRPDGSIDYDALRETALTYKPKVILAGFSAYPRELDYAKFVAIANEIGAIAYADMSHIGWLIAAGVLKNPLDYGFHAMMTTTHKSLRWPRGALILSKGIVSNPLKKPEWSVIENLPTIIDRAVFPGTQGWPHMNTIAAIAVALLEAQNPAFKQYGEQVIKNAKVMAEEFTKRGYKLVTGGTDNHMIVLDFSTQENIDGSISEKALDKIGISTSKSTIPDDPNPPFRPSGLRIGTPAMTTRGVKEDDMRTIVDFMDQAFKLAVTWQDPEASSQELVAKKFETLHQQVITFAKKFPVPGV